MGSFDHALRLLIAAIIGYLCDVNYISGAVGIVLLILAVFFAITGFVAFCPLYQLLGMNTCEKN